MASIKLNNSIRDEIVKMATKDAFADELNELKTQYENLAERVYRTLVTEEQEALMMKLPHGFFHSSDGIFVAFYKTQEDADQYSRNRWMVRLPFCNGKRMPANAAGHTTTSVVNSCMFAEADVLGRRDEAIKDKLQSLRDEVKKLTMSVGTVARLVEVWPEVTEFLPDEAKVIDTKALPATIAANVTTMLAKAKKSKRVTGDYADAINASLKMA